jgi:hypothetical protein
MKKTKAGLVYLISLFALSGTVFASWTFAGAGTTNTSGEISIDFSSTTTSVGTVEITSTLGNYRLVLGGPEDGDITISPATAIAYTWTAPGDMAGFTVAAACTWTLDTSLDNYISIATNAVTNASNLQSSLSNSVYTGSINLPTFSWEATKAPTTQALYNTMKTSIGTGNLNLSIVVTVTAA